MESVSIHTPTGGATLQLCILFPSTGGFNPHAHGGRDSNCILLFCHILVSIHTPTGGATVIGKAWSAPDLFQSTRPRGARHVMLLILRQSKRFNPHAHGGRDLSCTRRDLENMVSIHTPTGGATLMLRSRALLIMFQSTRPRGARPLIF